ncbi:hypothetical protein [Pseudoxanthomonas mexicana]|uniref:hypothetical protein n=1 Tax=Pseudoxanthomonas mexicana TaxID=128785 RepID=UPI001C8DFB27|nr:hypothetical protein [Pseudoxanthomonas mexicana]
MPIDRPKTKTANFQMRLAPQLKAAAEEAAKRDHRSLTSLIEVLILNHCKSNNIPIAEAHQEANP